MNVKYLIATIVETIIKVAVLAAVIVFVFRGATQAYDFGYRVFADEPVSSAGERTITVGIGENDSVRDIGQMLEEKGLIEDAKLFVVQEMLSAYHGDILPGIYDLSTGMTAEEMLEVMATPSGDASAEEERDSGEAAGAEGTESPAGSEGPEGEGAENPNGSENPEGEGAENPEGSESPEEAGSTEGAEGE